MNSPIIESLDKIVKDNIISFHMPGHKKGKIYEILGYTEIVSNLHRLDTTEIPGTDNLHNPQSSIKQSQMIAQKIFRSDYTFYLVNGSTCGIQAAIMACCKPNDKILINRDCHQSVINGCILGDIEPIYIKPDIDIDTSINRGYNLYDIKNLVQSNKEIKAMILTYPSYFGTTYNLKEICDFAHSQNIIVIIDEAHGAHLGLSDKLPKTAIEQGADIIIQSTHKTLPSLTQSSMLHIKSNNVDIEKIATMLRLTESSSPSYILMISLELSLNIYMNNGNDLMDKLIRNIEDLKIYCNEFNNIDIYDSDDITKIFIYSGKLGLKGYELEDILRNKYNIQVELSNYYGVLLITTIANDDSDFNELKKALLAISDNFRKNDKINNIKYPLAIPNKILNPRDAFYKSKKSVNIYDSIGKVCGEYIIPYPPGISLVSPGEEITKEIIDYIVECNKLGMSVSGIKDQTLATIQIIDTN